MLVNPFGSNRLCIKEMCEFLIAWQLEGGLWPEDLNDISQAKNRYSGWATIDCLAALCDVLTLSGQGETDFRKSVGTAVAAPAVDGAVEPGEPALRSGDAGGLHGGDPLGSEDFTNRLHAAIVSTIQKLIEVQGTISKDRSQLKSRFSDSLAAPRMRTDRETADKLTQLLENSDLREERFGLPRSILVREQSLSLGRCSVIEASLLASLLGHTENPGRVILDGEAKDGGFKQWLLSDFPVDLALRSPAFLGNLLATASIDPLGLETLRRFEEGLNEYKGHELQYLDGVMNWADVKRDFWGNVEHWARRANGMTLHFPADVGKPSQTVPCEHRLRLGWAHISHPGHGEDVLVNADPVATLHCAATLFGYLDRQLTPSDADARKFKGDDWLAEVSKSEAKLNETRHIITTLEGVMQYFVAWTRREINEDPSDPPVESSWGQILENLKTKGPSVFSLGFMTRAVLAGVDLMESSRPWLLKMKVVQSKNEKWRPDREKAEALVVFFDELFQILYALLVCRVYDILVRERSSPYEATTVRVVVGREITHWPGVDVGLVAFAALRGRRHFDLNKALAASIEALNARHTYIFGREHMDGSESDIIPLPLFQTLIALVHKSLVGPHNYAGALRGLVVSTQRNCCRRSEPCQPGKEKSALQSRQLYGAFVSSTTNLTDEQQTTIYSWSTAHALRALVEYERLRSSLHEAQLGDFVTRANEELNQVKARAGRAIDALCHKTCTCHSWLSYFTIWIMFMAWLLALTAVLWIHIPVGPPAALTTGRVYAFWALLIGTSILLSATFEGRRSRLKLFARAFREEKPALPAANELRAKELTSVSRLAAYSLMINVFSLTWIAASVAVALKSTDLVSGIVMFVTLVVFEAYVVPKMIKLFTPWSEWQLRRGCYDLLFRKAWSKDEGTWIYRLAQQDRKEVHHER